MTAENQFLRGQNPLLTELELELTRRPQHTPLAANRRARCGGGPAGPAAAAGRCRRGRYAVAQHVAASQAAASRGASADAAAPCQRSTARRRTRSTASADAQRV